MTYNEELPRPVGVFQNIDRPIYENEVEKQIQFSKNKLGKGELEKILNSGETWEIA